MTATFVTLVIPASKKPEISEGVKPAIKAPISGIIDIAKIGFTLPAINSVTMVTIIRIPITVSIRNSLSLDSFYTLHH